jgi:hypothetical protein
MRPLARVALMAIAGGARNDSSFETVGESWATTPSGWARMGGGDIAPRDHHAMVYDETVGAVLLFGGIPGGRGASWPADTWELRPDGWSRIAATGPSARARSAMAYDSRRRQVVLFGGVGAPRATDHSQRWLGDTWLLARGEWRKVATIARAAGRCCTAVIRRRRTRGSGTARDGRRSVRDELRVGDWLCRVAPEGATPLWRS